jgi:hypothetical protein
MNKITPMPKIFHARIARFALLLRPGDAIDLPHMS